MSSEVKLRQSSLELRSANRDKVFEKLFSQSAREGFDVVIDGEARHVPGYYEQFSNLHPEVVDEIVDRNEVKARQASNISYVGSILEGDLRRASVKERIRLEKDKNERKELKKELKHVKKGIKQLSKDIYP